MITAGQRCAARAMLGLNQRVLAEPTCLFPPTIQRIETSGGVIRGNVASLMKLVGALSPEAPDSVNDDAIGGNGGRGVRLVVA